jgi:hypothetical protein
MSLAVWFWVIFVISILFSLWAGYVPNQPWFRNWGGNLVVFVLIFILGLAVFGSPVNGQGPAPTYQEHRR